MSDTVPYYPSPVYLERKWAPEQYPVEALKRLAAAERTGIFRGVLRPDVSDYVLANTLAENRPRDYGVDPGQLNPRSKNYQRLGLFPSEPGEVSDSSMSALEAISVMADKQRDWRSPEEVVRKWNGGGADSRRHLERVKILREMLQDPVNAPVMEMYKALTWSRK